MSPKTQAQNEIIRKQSKRKILDAALKLFATKGFESTSVNAIAKEAGVAKGLIYNYFKSKDAIVHDLVLGQVQEGDGFMHEMMEITSAKEKLRYVFNLVRNLMKERYEYQKLVAMMSLKLEAYPELQEFIIDINEANMQMFISILADIGSEDPEKEALLLAATMNGITMTYMVLKDRYPMDQMIDDLIDKYCN